MKIVLATLISFSILSPSLAAAAQSAHSCCMKKEQEKKQEMSGCHESATEESQDTNFDETKNTETKMNCSDCIFCGLFVDLNESLTEPSVFRTAYNLPSIDGLMLEFVAENFRPPMI